MHPALEVFFTFLKLGLSSFGGPVAHLGYFHREFVAKRRWLEESTFTELIALCQFLPGPASSQASMAIGYFRAGPAGAFLAWLAFTLPSVLILIAFAYGLSIYSGESMTLAMNGLKTAAVAIVAHATWTLYKNFCLHILGFCTVLSVLLISLIYSESWLALVLLPVAGLAGIIWARDHSINQRAGFQRVPSARASAISLLMFFSFLILLPLFTYFLKSPTLDTFSSFYRAGALVFGGGHVVLPLLEQITVSQNLLSLDAFLAGYGAAQAIPGPLFSFAGYLGFLMQSGPSGLSGAALCLVAIFLPAALILFGTLRLWHIFSQNQKIQRGLVGVNAAVVGLLLTALINPIFTSGVTTIQDFFVVLISVFALIFFRAPTWLVVLFCTAMGFLQL